MFTLGLGIGIQDSKPIRAIPTAFTAGFINILGLGRTAGAMTIIPRMSGRARLSLSAVNPPKLKPIMNKGIPGYRVWIIYANFL